MLKFTKKFGMIFAENGTYGVPEFAGTEVNRRSGNLKGLLGYLQNYHPTPAPLATLTSPHIAQARRHTTSMSPPTILT
jgi:hypothetical protein